MSTVKHYDVPETPAIDKVTWMRAKNGLLRADANDAVVSLQGQWSFVVTVPHQKFSWFEKRTEREDLFLESSVPLKENDWQYQQRLRELTRDWKAYLCGLPAIPYEV